MTVKRKNMTEIAEFVNEKAQSQLNKSPKAEEIQKAKETLEKYSSSSTSKFTFTSGQMNAYMG